MRAAIVPAALVATAALTACGSSSVSPESVANAATKTATVKSYRMHTTTKLKVNGRDIHFAADGAFAPKTHRGRMTLDMSQLTQAQGPQGTAINFGYATFVLNGSDLYLRIPLLRQGGFKPWIKIDLRRSGQAGGIDFNSFLRLGAGGDPTKQVRALRAVGKLHTEGTETVRGVSTTHYSGTVDLNKVPGGRQLARVAGSSSIPVDVWVDGDGLVRRERWSEKLALGTARTKISTTMDLYDFGAPVVAVPPPAQDVTDLTGGRPPTS
jgi:LppX_LprAFG lipoprotein